MEPFRVAITGHRPGHLAEHGIDPVRAGERIVEAALSAAARRGRSLELRVGGALGIDRAVADAARAWRTSGVPLALVVAIAMRVWELVLDAVAAACAIGWRGRVA